MADHVISAATVCIDKNSAGYTTLSPLRTELKIIQAATSSTGTPCWTLYDPIRNRFFRLGWVEYEIIKRWSMGCAEKIVSNLESVTTIRISPTTVEAVRDFLATNQLLCPPAGKTLLYKQRQEEGIAKVLLHNYLFFRLPLWRPDRLLNFLLPFVRPFFTNTFLYAVLLLTASGLYLVSRDWETFVHSLPHFFTPNGALALGFTVAGAKIVHEFGHAFAAKIHGLKVPVMGIAFIILWPMLYTDTTDAWRLQNRKKRIFIDAAGMAAELSLAGVALFLWNFFAPGVTKSSLFMLATVVWVKTLAMNLSPFMRFDGYYIFSDLLDIPNLQERAFTLGRWWLRKVLFGSEAPCPELIPLRSRRILIGYAYTTWLYRLTLFTAIALTVYHFFFKALGIMLFAIEFGWFVLLPVAQELGAWFRLSRGGINLRTSLTIFTLGLLVLAFFSPWDTTVYLPALKKSSVQARIYPSFAARIETIQVRRGQAVNQDELLFHLDSPELRFKKEQAALEVQGLRLELERSHFSSEQSEEAHVLEERLAEAISALTGFERLLATLEIRAPVAGIVMELADSLRPGLWVSGKTLLAVIVNQNTVIVEGLVREADLDRLGLGQSAYFYPDEPGQPRFPLLVAEIEQTPTRSLASPYLASLYGGELPVRKAPDGRLLCDEALYLVTLRTDGPVVTADYNLKRGTVRLHCKPVSFFASTRQAVFTVLIRESDL